MNINDFFGRRTRRYRTANLESCILYIYSTNIGTEYFKHGIYSPFLSLQNAVCFIILTYLVPVLFTFYIQGVLKLKKNSGANRLKVGVRDPLRWEVIWVNMIFYCLRERAFWMTVKNVRFWKEEWNFRYCVGDQGRNWAINMGGERAK